MASIRVSRVCRPSELEAAFDILQRVESSLPSAEVDKRYFIGLADLKFGSGSVPPWVKALGHFKPRVVLPSESANTFPLNRHGVPNEPFYPVFLSTPWTKFPVLTPFLHQAISPHVPGEFSFSNLSDIELLQHLPLKTTCVTHGVEIECRTEYSGVESSPTPPHAGLENVPQKPSHVFRYVIVIRNLHPSREPQSATVALCSRHWLFVDVEKKQSMEVIGPGVVGEFPLLEPGDRHVYQSGTSLYSANGVMTGTFQFILTRRGHPHEEPPTPVQVDVRIAPTALRGPS